MKILATDLDRTLLPNGKWKNEQKAIPLFNKITTTKNLLVIYVTGRRLELTKQAISKYGIRYPNILIGDVGTTIRNYKNGKWVKEKNWKTHVLKTSPRWNLNKIKKLLSKILELQEQEKKTQNEFKQSYYFDYTFKKTILKKINTLIKGKFDEEIITSFDPKIPLGGLLDIIPKSATKKTALIYIMKKFNLNFDDVLFCGDSGNDTLALTAGFYNVIVKNGCEDMIKIVKKTLKKNNQTNRLYISKGNINGFNGYYTSGVLEGANHFGFITLNNK